MTLYRKILTTVCVLAFVATAASLTLQYKMGFDPCVLCIEQRIAILITGVLALVCSFLPQLRLWARTISALWVSIPASFGAYVAGYQLWLQSLPEDLQPSCGAPWTFRLQDKPLFDLYEPLVRGFGNCGVVEKFLGIPFPVWALLTCGGILLLLWGGWYRARRIRVHYLDE